MPLLRAYIGNLVLDIAVQDLIKHVNRSLGLEGNASSESLVVDVFDKLLGASLLVRGGSGFFGGSGVDSGFVVETGEVTSGLLEVLDPFLWLLAVVSITALPRDVAPGNLV